MTDTPRIVAFAGSTRSGSWNRMLLEVAVGIAREAGAEVDLLDLRDYPLPLYDADLEAREGIPEPVARLKARLGAYPGMLVASPEYNSSITPLLKNTIDWATRPHGPKEVFGRKVAALVSASPGALGGMRSLVHVRNILENIGVLVVPRQASVSKAAAAFAEDGSLVRENDRDRVAGVVTAFVGLVSRL